jgi:hypothetical protein
VDKVAVHYAQVEQQLVDRYRQMIGDLQTFVGRHGQPPPSASAASASASSGPTPAERADDARRLLALIVRLTSSLIQLENYAVMNYCGFGKALKKHDKLTGRRTKLSCMAAWVNPQAFAATPVLLRMLEGTEEAFQLLVTLEPDEARAGVIDAEEARQLEDLREVKARGSAQRAKEKGEGGGAMGGGARQGRTLAADMDSDEEDEEDDRGMGASGSGQATLAAAAVASAGAAAVGGTNKRPARGRGSVEPAASRRRMEG